MRIGAWTNKAGARLLMLDDGNGEDGDSCVQIAGPPAQGPMGVVEWFELDDAALEEIACVVAMEDAK